MTVPLGSEHNAFSLSPFLFTRLRRAVGVFLFLLSLGCAHAFAQTVSISGTVYDPRTTTNSLPLPNVLVYVTSATVAPLPSGVQCLTTTDPTGVVAFTYTAADGTFTIPGIPANATYTVVIQAGKWRRQFTETVASDPLTGLALHMPADHTQGDIPMIAIATGKVDALECVLLDMGIAPTEFTDDNATINSGGHIHLYGGSTGEGAMITGSTPLEPSLMTNTTTLNGYDVVMFPCQGSASNQATATNAVNLLAYANAGGRIFATHYSYAWLDPDPLFGSLFTGVANWSIYQAPPFPDPGPATINTGFTDGATLAQWLYNTGASTTFGQVQLSTLRHDVASVIAPTQIWATHNASNDIMQFTFNTPVGAAAASQCGRVLFTEYHVMDREGTNATTGKIFPAECTGSGIMTPQEEMLEFALFDLSSFVTPVVVPTLSIALSPNPVVVNQGDTADQVTINVTNTSASTQIYSSAVLKLTLPAGLTATALTDATGGWVCALSTLTCARTTSIAASASDSVTLTVSVPAYGSGSATTGVITATASSPNFSSDVSATDTVIFQQPPTITWPTPANIVYGTALSATQLNATASVAGSFSYSPAAGTVLTVGAHTLTATFTPSDTTHYTSATATVTLTVVPATASLSLGSNANPVFLSNAVTFTATVASYGTAPTGTIVFYDGSTQIGSGTVSAGIATFTTSSLAAAVHSITAVYSGDSSYGPATSSALSERVVDFTIAPSGTGAVTSAPSGLASFPLTITPVGGSSVPADIALTVTGLSLESTASFSPSTVASGSGTTTVTLLVQLPGKGALETPARPFTSSRLPFALGLILLPFAAGLRKVSRRFGNMAVLALIGAALALGVNGCGGPTIKSQSYTLSVTAASGALSHATSVKLTVQ